MAHYYTCRKAVDYNLSRLCLEPTVDGLYCENHAIRPPRPVWPLNDNGTPCVPPKRQEAQ